MLRCPEKIFECSNAAVHPFTPATGPSAWYFDQHKNSTDHIYDLSAEDVTELDTAVAAVIKSGKDIQVIRTYYHMSLMDVIGALN